MYVCVCRAVTDKQIHQAIDEGARSVSELREQLKVTECCGSCHDSVKECLQSRLTPREVAA